MTRSAIVQKLQEVAVGIARVHADRLGAPAADPLDRALLELGARAHERVAQFLSRALPHETEVAARRRRLWCAQREAFALPDLGPVEIDHLVPDVHRDEGTLLGDLEAQRAVER